MEAHECKYEETMGAVKEFMDSTKGFKNVIDRILMVIVVQVVGFGVFWGILTTTVAQNTHQVWQELTPIAHQNQLNIDRLVVKMDLLLSDKLNKSAQDFK
jgi:ascorbate-specific PTS system EIIC-type component UlaA